MTIHGDHPFATPENERSAVRRFRGRLPSPVTLWTAAHDGTRNGLTVSSVLVADGDPGYIVGLLDPDSDLWDTLQAGRHAVVSLLTEQHQQLADAFGYVAPAPGGPFRMAEWIDTEFGPALAGATWAGCRLTGEAVRTGWSVQVRLEIVQVDLGPEDVVPVVHRRGRYHRIA